MDKYDAPINNNLQKTSNKENELTRRNTYRHL